MSDERTKNLFLVVDHFAAVYTEWVEDSDTRFVTEGLETATDELVEIFSHGDIPGDCRGLAKAVDRLDGEWARFKSDAARTVRPESQMPGPAFASAVKAVLEARADAAPKPRRVLEPIAELTAQKVSDNQICKIYEWVDSNGHPQIWKLREERENPGKHTTGYVPPSQLRREAMANRERAILERIRLAHEGKHRTATIEGPETIEQLIAQGVSAQQIGKLKHVTVEEVMAAADAAGLERPPLKYDPLAARRGAHDRELNESEQRIVDSLGSRHRPEEEPADESADEGYGEQVGDGQPMTLEQEIIMYHQAGEYSHQQIADMVSRADMLVTRQKVAAIVKRYESDPAAFDAAEIS